MICIIGGDLRQVYLAEYFLKKGHSVTSYMIPFSDSLYSYKKYSVAASLADAVCNHSIIIGPVPFTRDNVYIFSTVADSAQSLCINNFLDCLSSKHTFIAGNIPEIVSDTCKLRHISTHDLLSLDSIAIKNAISTAEGAILEAISHSQITIHGSKCLVLGFGRCGIILADKLKGLNAITTICARNAASLAYAAALGYTALPLNHLASKISNYEFIFNTIPSCVLDKNLLQNISENVTIIDIASNPGGLDYSYVKAQSINAHLCLGLPAKIAPKSVASIFGDFIMQSLDLS